MKKPLMTNKQSVARKKLTIQRSAALDVNTLLESYDPEPKLKKSNPLVNFLAQLRAGTAQIESATLFQLNGYGQFKMKTVQGTKAFKEALSKSKGHSDLLNAVVESHLKIKKTVSAADKKEIRKLAESDFFGDGMTAQVQNPGFAEFIPLMSGPFEKQLYLHDYLDMHAKCFEAWNHNPIARQIINVITRFSLGDGVKWSFKSEKLQSAFTQWANDSKLSTKLKSWSKSMLRDGELMLRTGKVAGMFVIKFVDPSTIWEIITDPEDIERVFYYWQQYPTQYQVDYAGEGVETSKYVMQAIPAQEVIHRKINCSENEKRGRSELFPVLGWLKRLKDFYTAQVLRKIMQSSFVWDVSINGDDNDVTDFMNKFGNKAPDFGSVQAHNKEVEWKAAAVDSSATSLDSADGILAMIAVGVGIPKEYLGIGESSTRATALVSSEPGSKKFQDWQETMEELLHEIVKRFIQAYPEFANEDPEVEFTFPEIVYEDRSKKMDDISKAEMNKWISHRRASEMAVKQLSITTYDYQAEQAEIEAEASAGLEPKTALVPPAEPPAEPELDSKARAEIKNNK